MTLTELQSSPNSSPERQLAGAGDSSPLAPANILAQQCLALFRQGKDTLEIAKRLNMTEARASKLVWVARCREKGLPATFLRRDRVVARIAP